MATTMRRKTIMQRVAHAKTATLDYDATRETFGMLGRWDIVVCDGNGRPVATLTADQAACLRLARTYGVPRRAIRFTERARAAASAAFRAYYGR